MDLCELLVVVVVSRKVVLVQFELSSVVAMWVAPPVAENVGNNLSHAMVPVLAVSVSVRPLGLVWGSFFC